MKPDRRKKGYFITVLLAVLLTGLASGLTLSLLTDNERHINALSVGQNRIEISEAYDPPEPGNDQVFTKEIAVQNTGDIPCFVRLYLGFSDLEAASRASVSRDGGGTFVSFEEFLETGSGEWIYLDETGSGPGSLSPAEPALGGYFYYTESLMPQELTDVLCTDFRVVFESEEEKERLLPGGFDINVYAESVQIIATDGSEFTGEDAWKQAWTEFLAGKQ